MSNTQVLQVKQALAQGIERGAKRERLRGFVERGFLRED